MQPDWDIIESEVPGLIVRSVTLLGEGWTAKAYRVNEELVFKFPKRSAEWEELDREITFLAYARPLLPAPVAEHLYQIRHSGGAPHGYAVYRRLPGEALAVGGLSEPAGCPRHYTGPLSPRAPRDECWPGDCAYPAMGR